jgi:hypothetical protein
MLCLLLLLPLITTTSAVDERARAHAALLSACATDGAGCAAAAADFAAASAPAAAAAPRKLQADVGIMVAEGMRDWGYFGLAIKGRFVFCTVGAFAGVIVGPAVGLALIAAFLVFSFARHPVTGAAAAGKVGGGAPLPAGVGAPLGAAQRGNPLAGFPRVDPREEARRHWKNGAGELPPGWDWTEGDQGRVCYVDHSGATTYSDPRKNFEVYAHAFEVAAARGVDLLNMCVVPASPLRAPF